MIVLITILIFLILIYLNIFLTKEKFIEYSGDTIDSVTMEESILLVTKVLFYINKKYNKKLAIGNIDRVEKTITKKEINYKINIFIYNIEASTNKKVLFDISIKNNKIIINSVNNGMSRLISNSQRGGESSRSLVNFKSLFDYDDVKPYSDNITTQHNVQIKNIKETNKEETMDSIKDRHSWILDKEAKDQQHSNKFLTDFTTYDWDKYGVEYVIPSIKKKDKYVNTPGLNHSFQKINNIPNFIVSNFVLDDTSYEWMFDVSRDIDTSGGGNGRNRFRI